MMTNSFWALISLILFLLVLVYYKVPALVKGALLKRAEFIRNELDEARRLREEAQQLLSEYQKKRFEAENEANEIISAAKRQAEEIIADMRSRTDEYIAGRKKLAEQRIARAESEARALIRSAVSAQAIEAAGKVLADRLKQDKTEGERLFTRSLAEIEQKLKKAS